MATKDISDLQIVQAFVDAKRESANGIRVYPVSLLEARTGQHTKVCERAMERACERGYIDYGVSLRCGWITEKGQQLLNGAEN